MSLILNNLIEPSISWGTCLGFPGFCKFADLQLGRIKSYFHEIIFIGSLFSGHRPHHAPNVVDSTSITIPLNGLYNNQAASINGSTGDFNGYGATFPAELLPNGYWTYDAIDYLLPEAWGSGLDNVIGTGQDITLKWPFEVHELHVIYSSDGWDDNGMNVKFQLNFADESTQIVEYTARSYWRVNAVQVGAIPTPYHFEDYGKEQNWNISHLYEYSASVSSHSPLRSITLPDNSGPRLHVFALTLTPSARVHRHSIVGNTEVPVIAFRRVRFTQNWELIDGVRVQVVDVTVANLLPESKFSPKTSIASKYTIEISGSSLETVKPGVLNRLVASDQVTLRVLVNNEALSGNATVTLKDSKNRVVGSSSLWPIVPLVKVWKSEKNVNLHETPNWFDDAKYGIFIHWGLYSIPAWAPVGTYAEWYCWTLRNPAGPQNPTWQHHLDTYGPNFRCDDFIANFTAPKFNASTWLNLIDDAGAKYFVMTTKHHDGYALFDTENTTHRSSVHMGPKRDFIAELLETAKAEKPHIHRGTYFSMPEWFNPKYGKYGFQRWPGGLAHDPFNDTELEIYNGELEISDYLEDLQLPQMLLLAEKYDTEIMWCDIGGPNLTHIFSERFYNHALSQGRQVTTNDRCGQFQDYDTPEYARLASIQTHKWETSEGVDPGSYGLNSNTPDYLLRSPTTIVQTLVDVVSKNGNYLLDIGPDGDGAIIPAMVNNLLEAGKWLKYGGACIYSSRYWFKKPQDITGLVRYTTTEDAFCIISFEKPSDGRFVLHETLPLLPGDKIHLLGASGSLNWSYRKEKLVIYVSDADAERAEHAWAFQIVYSPRRGHSIHDQ